MASPLPQCLKDIRCTRARRLLTHMVHLQQIGALFVSNTVSAQHLQFHLPHQARTLIQFERNKMARRIGTFREIGRPATVWRVTRKGLRYFSLLEEVTFEKATARRKTPGV